MIRRVGALTAIRKNACCPWNRSSDTFIPVDPTPPNTFRFRNSTQRQQIRCFPAYQKMSQKGFGPNGTMLKLNFCYNDFDLYAVPQTPNHEKYQYVKSSCDLEEIKAKTVEEFKTDKDLEFFDGEKWVPLTNVKDIREWKGGMIRLDIRVPSIYDDVYEETVKAAKKKEDKSSAYHTDRSMKDVIRSLVLNCKLAGTVRSGIKPLYLKTGKVEISTKEWILKEADKDPNLQSIILRQAGALDHLVQCVHYDIVWKRLKDEDPKVDPESRHELQLGHLTRSFVV
jgi:hypothetical protein